MKYVLPIVSSFGGGVLVGGAYSAFITLIKTFPRLIQVTDTHKYLKLYESVFIFSTLSFTLIYFSDFSLNLGTTFVIISGLFSGIFLGVFSSALAETLNVMPIITKKFKIKKQLKLVFISLILGKVCGALFYFIYSIGGSNGQIK